MSHGLRGRRTTCGFWLTAALCLGAGTVGAQTAPTHAAVSLVSEDAALKPGAPAWLGVRFELEPGWHIYWVNPGDAGDPPRLRWELPPGFRTNDVRWPVPERLVLGPIVDYGYEGQVLLALPIDVPSDYKANAPVTMAADVRYVICREVCIPARARVSLSMPLAEAASPSASARRELFASARARWPKPMPAAWKATLTGAGPNLTLSIRTGTAESKAAFFPLEADQIDNAAPQPAKATTDGIQLTLRRADPDAPAPPTIRGVIVLAGAGRAYEIDVKLN